MALAMLGGKPVRTSPYPCWPEYGEPERRALIDVLESRSWGGYNESIRRLEERFAALHQVRHAISCANGTVALEVALRAAGIGCGDEVIVPAFTFVATATAVMLCHGSPVFADIEPGSFNLSPEAAEAAITHRTRAIIVVHFGGYPADMDKFTDLAQRRGLALIEDSAHAHGAQWRGTPVGKFGLAGTFSFQAFKLVTSGEGGIMVADSDAIAEKLRAYCNHGRREGRGWYEHFTLGSNYRISGFQTALLCSQLDRLEEQHRRRQENADYLRQQLSALPGIIMPSVDERVTRNTNYVITLRYDAEQFSGLARDSFVEAVRAEGIPISATYPYPLYRNEVFRCGPQSGCVGWSSGQNYAALDLPECERACRDGIWIEQNLLLGDRPDVDDILAAFTKVRQHAGAVRTSSLDSGDWERHL